MKYAIAGLLCIMAGINAHAQSVAAIERKLCRYLDTIQHINPGTDDYDRLDSFNMAMMQYLLQTGSKQPAMLQHTFPEAVKKGLDISTSADKKVRVYSWDTWEGGTMHFYISILQFASGKGVKTFQLDQPDTTKDGGDAGYYYTDVKEITNSNGKKYYLLTGVGRYSTKDRGTIVKAISIDNGALNDTVKFFIAGKKQLNNISYYYDLFASADKKKDNSTLHFSSDMKTMYIPVVDGEVLTGRYLIYKFDGEHYVFDKNARQ